MFVRTERLFLRPAWPEDIDDLLEVFKDGDVRCDLPVSIHQSATSELHACLEQSEDPRLPHFFMYLRSAGGPHLVGGIGFRRHGEDVEMGCWMSPRFRGRGYAAEAVRAALRQARSLGHRRIYANHIADRGISAGVLESAGFHDTGRVCPSSGAGRAAEGPVHIYMADLEQRSPRIEPVVAAMDA